MIYREEHPNPQWERSNWRNLNGEWEFDFDFGRSARDKKLYEKGALPKKINIPFCPESELSGIGYTDFINGVCYRKLIEISKDELNGRIILHFGAVDYESFIYVNGKLVKSHVGGYSSFSADITDYAKEGENEIFVIAEDDIRSRHQPSGKQSDNYNSYGCFYTRTTGIWQTVWLEFVPKAYIQQAKYYPDIDNGTLTIIGKTIGSGELTATAAYEGKPMAKECVKVCNGFFTIQLKLSEVHLWELGHGRLYDLELTFGEDKVKSYFGMRSVRLDDYKFMLNNKSVFQRLVLDQGYYPDGIYTAKTDDDLKKDIELSMKLGFNGARLHEKIFEARFLYHCDKAGYMVWGEHANWGMDYYNAITAENFISEWLETVARDFNHPSIIGWCPFNETWNFTDYQEKNLKNKLLEDVYHMTKQLDPTRICIDTSGNYHTVTDIFDVHDYEGDPEKFKEYYAHISEGIVKDQIHRASGDHTQKYNGEPIFVSEYGGIRWSGEESGESSWGYGDSPKTVEEFVKRYKGLTDVLLDNPYINGFCYTQLYDVEQEQNGLYYYSREEKFDAETIREINSRKAAIED